MTTQTPKHIIAIICDDLGVGDVGCFHGPATATPHIDALAARGVRCTGFTANGAVCSPSRAAFFTGRYQQRCGIDGVVTAGGHRDVGMHKDELTFMELVHRAGWRTALFGKWHLGYREDYNPVQFGCESFKGYVSGNVDYHSHVDQAGHADWWHDDHLQPEAGYVTDLITDHALHWLDQHHEQQPCCCVIAHEAPHYPYQGRQDTGERQVGEIPANSHGERQDRDVAYAEIITALDENVGRISSWLEQRGLLDECLFVFTADHGTPTTVGSNGPWRGHKSTLFEGGLRVPTVISWPAQLAAGSNDAGLMHMDLAIGILAAAGVTPPADRDIDGINALAIVAGQPMPERDRYWRYGPQAAMRQGPWKWYRRETNGETVETLINLDDDPTESQDLSAAQAERVAAMTAAWQAWEKAVCARPCVA